MPWPPADAADAADAATAADADANGAVLLPVHRGPPEAEDGWAGLCGFHAEHQVGGWLRPGVLALATIAAGERACFVCDTGTVTAAAGRRRVAPPGWERGRGSVDLLRAAEGLIVVQCSNIATPAQVWACRVGGTAEKDAWVQLADAATLRAPPAAALAPARASVAAALAGTRIVTLARPMAEGGASAILAIPPQADGEAKLPWVLRPHGGPHAVTTDEFAVQTALLLAAGVAVLQPNYRGSLSFGADFGEALLGEVGELDVNDCGALTRLALEEHADVLDPERGGCYGGSHGGFLTAWLLGHPEHKELFRCGALWNPVTNLPSMVTVTDIPEWCIAACLSLTLTLALTVTPTRTLALALALALALTPTPTLTLTPPLNPDQVHRRVPAEGRALTGVAAHPRAAHSDVRQVADLSGWQRARAQPYAAGCGRPARAALARSRVGRSASVAAIAARGGRPRVPGRGACHRRRRAAGARRAECGFLAARAHRGASHREG